MKYKKRSLKNRRQKRKRHHFSKKYAAATVQRGGGFMDTIAQLIAMEGRTHTCMAVHPTQPLVAVGDDAGIVTLWEINSLGQVEPKRVAQLTGLPTAVKFVEFHPTIPVVAASCSDRVLMWRVDQINREQQDQQVEPSHTVSDFRARSEEEVEQELREAQQILEEERRNNERVNTEIKTLRSRNWQVIRDIEKLEPDIKDSETFMRSHIMRGEKDKAKQYEDELNDQKPRLLKLQEEIRSIEEQRKILDEQEFNILRGILGKEKIVKEKAAELQKIKKGARDEVSCFSFHPRESYIAVGVNNNKQNNQIIMYGFKIEPSSSVNLYSLHTVFRNEGNFPQSEKVLFTSFSSDGQLFSFVTIKSDGRTVLKVINFKDGDNRFMDSEYSVYNIPKKCAVTCITPYRTSSGFHNGSFYKFAGMMHTHGFIIGCDDGSLMLIEAVTIYALRVGFARVEAVRKSKEWNFREAIECVAVHPKSHSLPLFASGSRNAVQVWDESKREPEPLVVQPQVNPVRSIGFNQNFLAVCGPGNVRIYSCNAEDYRGFKEELQKELKVGSEIAEYGAELVLAGRQGEPCSICFDPMNDPLSQQALRSGPADTEEVYLECGHKFHKDCIEPLIKQRKPCPLCRAQGGIAQATPQRIVKGRDEQELEKSKIKIQSIADELKSRTNRYQPRILFGQPATTSSASSAFEAVPVAQPVAPQAVAASAELTPNRLRAARVAYFSKQQQQQQQQPPSENSGGGSKQNKYSRKKYSSKKLKNRQRYSKKYNK